MIDIFKIEHKLGLRCYGGGQSSGSGSSTPQLTPQQLMEAYSQNMPVMLGATLGTSQNTANILANTAAGANPIYTQSVLNQLNNNAGGYQQAGGNLAAQQALIQAGLIGGSGGLAASMGTGLVNTLNPTQALSTVSQIRNGKSPEIRWTELAVDYTLVHFALASS